MSILIKGMKLPKSCYFCRIGNQAVIGLGITCRIAGRTYANDSNRPSSRPSWCPLIEVLTPHGRLIDADDFDSRIRAAGGQADEELTDDFKDGVLSVLTLMKTQNTVIEAEG